MLIASMLSDTSAFALVKAKQESYAFAPGSKHLNMCEQADMLANDYSLPTPLFNLHHQKHIF